MAAVPDGQLGAGTDPIVVQESRLSFSVLFGGLLAVFALALVRGLAGAQTLGGRVAVAVIFGAAAALAAWAWVAVIRRRGRLEITGQAITYAGGKGQPVTLSRERGDVLRVVGAGRPPVPGAVPDYPGDQHGDPAELLPAQRRTPGMRRPGLAALTGTHEPHGRLA